MWVFVSQTLEPENSMEDATHLILPLVLWLDNYDQNKMSYESGFRILLKLTPTHQPAMLDFHAILLCFLVFNQSQGAINVSERGQSCAKCLSGGCPLAGHTPAALTSKLSLTPKLGPSHQAQNRKPDGGRGM